MLVDRQSLSLLFIDLQTGELRIEGGSGEGPGEFAGMAPQLGRGPGGLVAWDMNLRRATFYSGDGDLIKTQSVTSGLSRLGFETFLGALEGDGGLAFWVHGDPDLGIPGRHSRAVPCVLEVPAARQ